MQEIVSAIVVPVPIELAWDVFMDFESWGMRRKIYDQLEWLQGLPWQQHSRARLRQLWPYEQNVLIRVMQSHKPDLLSSLYHANGLTSTKNVRFHALDERTTEIRIETELLGEAIEPEVAIVDDMLRKVYEQTLADYAAECRLRFTQGPRSETPENPNHHGKSA